MAPRWGRWRRQLAIEGSWPRALASRQAGKRQTRATQNWRPRRPQGSAHEAETRGHSGGGQCGRANAVALPSHREDAEHPARCLPSTLPAPQLSSSGPPSLAVRHRPARCDRHRARRALTASFCTMAGAPWICSCSQVSMEWSRCLSADSNDAKSSRRAAQAATCPGRTCCSSSLCVSCVVGANQAASRRGTHR